MDEQQLASNQFALGAERLKLIGKHATALMQGYVQGRVDETQFSERALKQLLSANVIYQPDEGAGLILRPLFSDLIASLVADENRRHLNADVADKLETIRTRVMAYEDALQRGDSMQVDFQLQLVNEQVHDLSGQFAEAIDSLWNRLNSNFGFVSSLNDKIRENERAQKQIRRLLDGLGLIDFAQLIEWAAGNAALRKILVSRLQIHIDAHHTSLLEVQKRLVQLMGRFREQQARSLLIANMAGFLRQHPGFQVGDYAWRSQVPTLVNQAPPLVPAAALAIDQAHEQTLVAAFAAQAGQALTPTVSARGQAQAEAWQDNDAIEAREQALKKDVESFLLMVVESETAQSALNYLYQRDLPWDAEVWLFQVLGEYQALPAAQRRLFNLQRDEHAAHAFNSLQIIEDLHLQCTVAA